LDVGTGCGFFLAAAKKRGWQVQGIEPSLESVEISRKRTGVPVLHGTLRECDGRDRFDAVTFINVLDHSALPWLEIDCAGKLLRPGGQIYLRFPNGYLHSRIYRMAYTFGLSDLLREFLVFHMYSFTPKYIIELLHDCGFVGITILNSPPSKGDPHGLFPHTTLAAFIKILIYSIGQLAKTVSWGKLFLGTSLEVTATKPL
jgi:SAM-dependent methyltransferase